MSDTTENLQSGTGTVSVPAGSVIAFYGNPQSIPTGWFLCNGRQLIQDEINKYPTLAGLLKPYNYYLPNLGGRTIVGTGTLSFTDPTNASNTKTETFDFPGKGGEYEHLITDAEMPSHQHFGWGEDADANNWGVNGGSTGTSINAIYKGEDNKIDYNNRLYGSTFTGGVYGDNQIPVNNSSITGGALGSNTAAYNMQPYSVLSYMICGG